MYRLKKLNMMKKITFLIIMLLAFSYGNGQIVAWSMVSPNTLGNEVTLNARTLNPNLNMSTLRRGAGIDPANLARAFSSDDYTVVGTQTDAINNDDYIEFDISAVSTYQVSLSTLDANFRRSGTGPNTFLWRYSTDGVVFTDIGSPISYTSSFDGTHSVQAQINLSSILALQNVVSGTIITFRLYAWGATNAGGTFAIGRRDGNELSVGGSVTLAPCPGGITTWNGTTWDSGIPDLTTEAIIDGDYNTATDGSFSACTLTVNGSFNLNVSNGTFVEVENDVVVDGNLTVQSQGNFVQNDNGGSFILNGTASVNKQTAPKADWFYYTYWSSPVIGETIGSVFPDAPADRRFWFNAANFVDNSPTDDIDDNADDWQYALGTDTMIPGVGYAVTESRFFAPPFGPASGTANFEGAFNNGDIPVTISLNATNTGENWNFIGNPYPSALDFDAFYLANSGIIEGAAYFWSQASPPSELNLGNEGLNFNLNDYVVYTVGAGAGTTPGTTKFVGSCQGFFIPAISAGTATFTNAMRMADGTSNSQFFKNTKTKKSNTTENKLWLNLTSGNGVSNQILIAYVDGASDSYDGMFYDAPKLLTQDYAAALYSLSESDQVKYAIQCKDVKSINESEIIKFGLSTNIEVATIYSLSLEHFEGDFLSNNTVYLKDNLTNTVHNLSDGDYSFTSEVGEFNARFEIAFNAASLSNDEFALNNNAVKIVQLDNNNVKFTTETSTFKSVTVFDLLGRALQTFNGDSNNEIYNLSTLKNSVYIANIELANGAKLSKKFIKN